MSDLDSFAGGRLARQKYDQNKELHDVAMQEAPVKQRAAEVDLKAAENALSIQETMMQMMKGEGGQPGQSGHQPTEDEFVGRLKSIADMQMKAGDPVAGAKTAATASNIERNSAYIAAQKAKRSAETIGTVQSNLAGVHDQASWEKAIQDSVKEIPEHTIPDFLKGPDGKLRPYDPMFVAEVKNHLGSAKDRALAQFREAQTRAAEAREKTEKERPALVRAQTRLANDRDIKLKKAGVLAPKAEDVKAITDHMIEAFPEYSASPANMANARVIARPLAEDMLDMMKREGLTRSEASARIFELARVRGDFAGRRPARLLKGTIDSPLPLPADKKDLKEGQFYKPAPGSKLARQGAIPMWTKGGWVLPPIEQPAGGSDEEVEEPPDEGDDSE